MKPLVDEQSQQQLSNQEMNESKQGFNLLIITIWSIKFQNIICLYKNRKRFGQK